MPPIYLDNNATTPVDPRVLDAMYPYFTVMFGNAASGGHAFGRAARQSVEAARASIARALNAASPAEIVFTSGATESDNLAIKGVVEALRASPECLDHVVTVQTEHKAVLDTCRHLERQGCAVTYLGVGCDGRIDLDELGEAITDRTALVSVMAGNNEIGVVQDIGAIGALCRERGVLFHTDATQFVGKLPFDAQAMNVDLASMTAHKVYGPKGCGALYVRRDARVRLTAQVDGGGHEFGYRSGTLNVPGIVGLAKALELCVEEQAVEIPRLTALRLRLLEGLRARLDGVRLNGHPTERLPGHLSLTFDGVSGERLLAAMPEVALSTVAACSTGASAPSHVLRALGLSDEQAASTVRFGIGRSNTEAEIDCVVDRVTAEVSRLRTPERAASPTAAT